MTDYEKILKWICEQAAQIPCSGSYDGGVYPCTWAAKDLGIELPRVRRLMKQLEAQGYVVKGYAGGWDDWNGKLFCVHGYAVTKKAVQTKYWQEKRQREEEDLARLCEG